MEKQIGSGGTHEPLQSPSKRKLLLVDENVDALRYHSTILNQWGCDVRSFTSYSDALDQLGREAFHLIIVDQGSLDLEGGPAPARAIEKGSSTPVIMLTRSLDIPCYLDSVHSGARDYLEKAFYQSVIDELFRRHLQIHAGSA